MIHVECHATLLWWCQRHTECRGVLDINRVPAVGIVHVEQVLKKTTIDPVFMER
jgi:hypothetical protein